MAISLTRNINRMRSYSRRVRDGLYLPAFAWMVEAAPNGDLGGGTVSVTFGPTTVQESRKFLWSLEHASLGLEGGVPTQFGVELRLNPREDAPPGLTNTAYFTTGGKTATTALPTVKFYWRADRLGGVVGQLPADVSYPSQNSIWDYIWRPNAVVAWAGVLEAASNVNAVTYSFLVWGYAWDRDLSDRGYHPIRPS